MSKLWRSGPSGGGRVGLRIEELLGEFRIGNGAVYVGCAFGERCARVSRLESILLAGDVPDRDATGAFVWSSREDAEAALNQA
jgi:hypothetical protein